MPLMNILHHATSHVIVHIALFSGFALLVPTVSAAFEQGTSPWVASPNIFFAGTVLVFISAFMLYRIKESASGMLQSLGANIFLPGALSVLGSVLSLQELLSGNSITGMAVVKPVAEYYVNHSVPTMLSVAAVYLLIGGALYWVGNKMETVKSKFSFGNS